MSALDTLRRFTPHYRAGILNVTLCAHQDDPDLVGHWDVNMVDYYGLIVTIGEFPTAEDAVEYAKQPISDEWNIYLAPYKEKITL